METQETKKCSHCGKELPVDQFKKIGWGLCSWCKECNRKYARERKQKLSAADKMPWFIKY